MTFAQKEIYFNKNPKFEGCISENISVMKPFHEVARFF